MKTEKARLADLAFKMKGSTDQKQERSKASIRKEAFGNTIIEANPPHGEKGDFRKITVTLPPEAYELLVKE